MKCNVCKAKVHRCDDFCISCGSQQLIRNGMFGWWLFGFVGGILVPCLIALSLVLVYHDARVADEFLNVTLMGRSRWAAVRRGAIVVIIMKIALFILAFASIAGFAAWIAHGAFNK